MEPIQITAWMSSAIALPDDWSPDLVGIVIATIFDKDPRPFQEDLSTLEGVPFAKTDLGSPLLWYFACSSPCYELLSEEVTRFRKRWDADDGRVSWGKRKPQFNASEGSEKNYDLPLPLRGMERIDWFAIGDIGGAERLLKQVTHLGKKRKGVVARWVVKAIAHDWHLYRNNELMRPIPISCKRPECLSYGIRDWGWRPPIWLPKNKERCAMPVITVIKPWMNNQEQAF